MPLSVYSAFSHAMTVSSVRAEPTDARLVYRPLSVRAPVVLEPEKKTALGELVFEPARACEDDCYTGFQLGSKREAECRQEARAGRGDGTEEVGQRGGSEGRQDQTGGSMMNAS